MAPRHSSAGAILERFALHLKRIYFFLAYQVFSVLLLFALLETGTRLLTEHITPIDINARTLVTNKDHEPFFQLHPFAAFTWVPHARFRRQSVNADGFVSTRDIPMEKKRGEFRILTLGGSSTVGNGNEDEQTYPRILETRLADRFPDLEISVINGATGGYTTIESLGYLQTRLIHYQPDLILVMHGWNDMYYFTLTDREISEWRSEFNLEAMWNPKVAVSMEDPLPAIDQYLSWSQFYLHLREWIRRNRIFQGEEPDIIEYVARRQQMFLKPVNPAAFAVYRNNLAQIRNLCSFTRIRCYTILQPTLVTPDADPAHRSTAIAKRACLSHGFDFETHIGVFEKLYEINRSVFDADQVIDATSMSGESSLFRDHIHQNSQGTERLAHIVVERIVIDVEAHRSEIDASSSGDV